MGAYQSYIQEIPDVLGPLGQRWGDGHRPARNFHAGLPVAQVDSITIVDASDGTTLTVVIDGITFTSLDSVGVGAAGIAAGFVSQINAHHLANQIVKAADQGSGVFHLTAKRRGTAFTATASAAGGASTATRAAVTANNAGVDIDAGMPMFRPAGGSNAGFARLPAATTDVFLGVVQHRHTGIEMENNVTAHAYPAGSQIPVDPDGMHVVLCTTGCNPGDPVHVALTTGLYRNSGLTGQVTRVTVAASPSDSVTFSIFITNNSTGATYEFEYLADASSTSTEVRDGLEAAIDAGTATHGFSAVDVSTDAIDITGPAGVSFTVLPGQTGSELTVANQSGAGSILLPNARWESAAAAGNKALMAHDVP